MPPLRRKLLNQRVADAENPAVRYQLRFGAWWPFLDTPEHGEPTEDELKATWQEVVADLIAELSREHPGTRPWAWWKWDAPEPRQQVIRYITDDGYELKGEGPAHYFGKPSRYNGLPPEDMYETERAYLERLGLLLPGEKTL